MNPLDPLDGICPARHPVRVMGGCVRGRGHPGPHETKDGVWFSFQHECRKCIREMEDVKSISGQLIGRRCVSCGTLEAP